MKAGAGKGIFSTCIAFLCFTVMDATLKWVGNRAPVMEEFFVTTAIAALVVFLYGTNGGRHLEGIRTRHLKLHAGRGVLYIVQFCLVIYSFRHVTLAEFYALIFTAPLFVTVLSAVFLKETVGWRRWTATSVGFIGVLIDLRPSAAISIVDLYVLLSSLLYSVDILLMRIASRTDSAAATTLYVQLTAMGITVAYLAFNYTPVSSTDLAWLVLAGVLAGIGLMTLVTGFSLATTPVAAPFHYTQLIWGVALGWFIWHDMPDKWTWIGAAIIVGSGLYVLHRETTLGRKSVEATP